MPSRHYRSAWLEAVDKLDLVREINSAKMLMRPERENTQMRCQRVTRDTLSRRGKQRQKTAAPTDVGRVPPRRQPVQASLLPF